MLCRQERPGTHKVMTHWEKRVPPKGRGLGSRGWTGKLQSVKKKEISQSVRGKKGILLMEGGREERTFGSGMSGRANQMPAGHSPKGNRGEKCR